MSSRSGLHRTGGARSWRSCRPRSRSWKSPPSPIGRAIGVTIVLLFCAALAWAWLGSIDIVASATGKIVPSGRTKVIQPFETGVVRSIQVQDGQAVKAGDLLIELDPTVNAAERDHLRNDVLAEQLNIARLRAALADGDDPVADFTPPADADAALISAQRQLLLNQVTEHRAKIAALVRQQAQKDAEQATTAATIHKLETLIPAIQPRVEIRKTLMERELGSKLTYYETLQLLLEQQEELSVQKSRLQEAVAAVAAIRETRGQAEGEYRHALSDELAKAEQKASGLAQDLIKAEQKTRLQLLTAPVDGVVQQLAIHTVGGVVTPAQSLLVIVPSDSRLEIEAWCRTATSASFVPARKQRSKSTPSILPDTACCTVRCSASRRTPSSATGNKTVPMIAGRRRRMTAASRRVRS